MSSNDESTMIRNQLIQREQIRQAAIANFTERVDEDEANS
jgi:hypothetical protein